MSSIKIRAKDKGGVTTVKCLVSHPMETGLRKNKKTGKKIPPHFIETVTAEHKGNAVMTTLWSGGVSKNPYLSFKFKGAAAGDDVKISWTDNTGKSDSATAQVK
ncbi:MAG TPA: thiosulfate oxidation carrier complex protein SoxZ [Gammaproteobacteria bacterium]|nr:thiosulfate oxidation carrier complex protein SoxZ [Gammaproteobacteria bacterium]